MTLEPAPGLENPTGPISFRRFAYFDTLVHSELARDEHLTSSVSRFLIRNDLCVVFGPTNLVELFEADRLGPGVARALLAMPSCLAVEPETVLEEELAAFPKQRRGSLLAATLNQMILEDDGELKLLQQLRSAAVERANRGHRANSPLLVKRHRELKSNFPVAKSGRHEPYQSREFANAIIRQSLEKRDDRFLERLRSLPECDLSAIKSIDFRALVQFFKFYVNDQTPNPKSDLGDLLSLYLIPYCVLVVMERNLCEIFKQISRHHEVLSQTQVENITFLRKLA